MPAGTAVLARDTSQPTFTQTNRLNQDACSVCDSYRNQPASSVFARTCPITKMATLGARESCQQPNDFKPCPAAPAINEKGAVKAGEAYGKDECADEGNVDERVRWCAQAHQPQRECGATIRSAPVEVSETQSATGNQGVSDDSYCHLLRSLNGSGSGSRSRVEASRNQSSEAASNRIPVMRRRV